MSHFNSHDDTNERKKKMNTKVNVSASRPSPHCTCGEVNNNNNKKKIVTPIEKRMASCAIFTVKYVATLLTTTPKRAGGTPFGGTTRQR